MNEIAKLIAYKMIETQQVQHTDSTSPTLRVVTHHTIALVITQQSRTILTPIILKIIQS